MGPAHLNRIPVTLHHHYRKILQAVADVEGKPLATILKDMVIRAIELSLDEDGTWWAIACPAVKYPPGVHAGDKDFEPSGSYGPQLTVARFRPFHLDLAAQRRPKRSGARSGSSSRKPAQSRGGAVRRKKGAK